jgi:tRNA threonylcarbamoyladenosine biosynthesis protein TsaE
MNPRPPIAKEQRNLESLTDTKSLAGEIAASSWPRLLLLLDGPMGAGKTQFTRFFMQALGSGEACSPSFAIHNRYETSQGAVEHIDLYRMESEEDLESTGFWDLFLEKKGVVIIEWSDRLREIGVFDQLPLTWPRISLRFEVPDAGSKENRIVQMERHSVQ